MTTTNWFYEVICVSIKKNAAKCGRCNEVIESKHRHDFVTCSCGGLSVDGGHAYIKRSICVDAGYTYEELSEEDPEENKEC